MESAFIPLFIQKMAKRGPTFADLKDMALEELKVLGGRAEVVCGPISTGGYGSGIANLAVFNHAIQVLQHHGRPMWSQMPYEAGLAELERQWKIENPGAKYCEPILTEFYQPLFDATPRLVCRAWFLDGKHGWKTSKGATWEHERMTSLGIPISYFAESWHSECRLPNDLD